MRAVGDIDTGLFQVRPGNTARSASTVQDPDGKLALIEKRWSVKDGAMLGARTEDGAVKKTSFHSFKKGDFVDASFSIDIIRSRGGLFFAFNLEGLILLESAQHETVSPLV